MNWYFTKNDEWAAVEDGKARIGLSKEGVEHLGDVTFVDLPKVGQTLTLGQAVCTVEAVKAAVDFYSPLSGTVLSINTELKKRPEILNESPEEAGWIAEISLDNPKETAGLLSRQEYQAFLMDSE